MAPLRSRYVWQGDPTSVYYAIGEAMIDALNHFTPSTDPSQLLELAAAAEELCSLFESIATSHQHTYDSFERDSERVNGEASRDGQVAIVNPFTALAYLRSTNDDPRVALARLHALRSSAAATASRNHSQLYSFQTVSSKDTDWQGQLLDEIRSVLDAVIEGDEIRIMKAIVRAQGVRQRLYRAMEIAGTPITMFPDEFKAVRAALARGDSEIIFEHLSTAERWLYTTMVYHLQLWQAIRSENGHRWRSLGSVRQELAERILAGPNEDGKLPQSQPLPPPESPPEPSPGPEPEPSPQEEPEMINLFTGLPAAEPHHTRHTQEELTYEDEQVLILAGLGRHQLQGETSPASGTDSQSLSDEKDSSHASDHDHDSQQGDGLDAAAVESSETFATLEDEQSDMEAPPHVVPQSAASASTVPAELLPGSTPEDEHNDATVTEGAPSAQVEVEDEGLIEATPPVSNAEHSPSAADTPRVWAPEQCPRLAGMFFGELPMLRCFDSGCECAVCTGRNTTRF